MEIKPSTGLGTRNSKGTNMDALGITLQQLLTQLVSFLILFFLLYKLAYGPIVGMLDSRSQKIKDSLEAAETARLEAESSAEKVEADRRRSPRCCIEVQGARAGASTRRGRNDAWAGTH